VHDLPLITTIAAAFTAALVLGLLTHRLRLSPIVGYLIAGVLIGPHTPGFVGDVGLAMQLAEVGVILLMFGVGLHFRLKDLMAVRRVAVPGALGQSAVATVLGMVLAVAFGMSLKGGMVLGMAMAVASTVVLVRVLTDNKMLDTSHGHVAVGWLIVEDILTVVLLVLIPAMGTAAAGAAEAAHGHAHAGEGQPVWLELLLAVGKLAVLVAVLLLAGSKVIPWLMVQVARLRSRELFTLTVLVMAVAIATGSYYLFGASMALGAFLAGMVVGQSPVSHQAAADALPLRDAFAVLFFVAVGMLFDPRFLIEHPWLLLGGLGIIMIGKPLAALTIVALIGYPVRTGLTVALALAQIGEFSFILSALGRDYGLIDQTGHNLLVACAIVSITLNPMLFRAMDPLEAALKRRPRLWRWLNRRVQARRDAGNAEVDHWLQQAEHPRSLAVVLGYGPVGRTVDTILRENGMETVVVDLNMDTVQALRAEGRAAIYGDAYNIEVLAQAVGRASHLVITLPHGVNRNPVITAAKLINPEIHVLVRAHYLGERADLMQAGADAACYEEAEAAIALADTVLRDFGHSRAAVDERTTRIRSRLFEFFDAAPTDLVEPNPAAPSAPEASDAPASDGGTAHPRPDAGDDDGDGGDDDQPDTTRRGSGGKPGG